MNRYEREHPGTGGVRAAVNYACNRRFWDDARCVEDAKGWVQPFANWQGWDELNRAIYALRCVLLFRRTELPPQKPLFGEDGKLDRGELHRGMTLGRIESDMRSFHFHIARSRRCDKPRLP